MSNVEITLKTIIDKAVSDIKKVNKTVGETGEVANKASTGTDKLNAALKGMATALGVTASLAVLVNAVKKFSAEAIEAAARSQELQAKFNVVFGQTAPKARQELDNFGKEVNRSRLELQEMAADMQGVLAAMGLNRAEAADYSVELTKLSVDVAAFNNAQDVDVMNSFQSALVGNHIAAKKYGIVINDAALNAELLTMGIRGGTQAATEAEKVIARYNIIMRATADAQGQATLEADSYTNVSKGLEAAMMDLKVAVGDSTMPAMTKLKSALTDLVVGTTENINRERLLREAYELGAITQEYYRDAKHRASMQDETSAEKLEKLIQKYKEENGIVDEAGASVDELTFKQQEHAKAIDEVTAAQKSLEAAQQSWMNNTANQVESALKNLNMPAEGYTNALKQIDTVMGTNKVNEKEQADRIKAITDEYGKTGNVIAFGDALYKLKNDYMPETTKELEKARDAVQELEDKIISLKREVEEEIAIKVVVQQTGNLPELTQVLP